MTKADWLVLAGYLLLIAGTALIYRPLGFLVGGAVCILLGRAAMQGQRPAAVHHSWKDFE
jgi:hypothetical protein